MNPAVIDSYGWAMAEVYGACTDKILVNLAKYFPYLKAGDEIKGSFEYQARMLAQMGKVDRETVQIIIDHLNGADEALRNALTEAILQGLKDEEPKLRRAAERGLLSGGGVPELSPNQMQAFKSYYRQSADKLNLVNTVMLESTEAAYRSTVADVAAKIQRTQSILNIGTGEVVTGVSSYNSAVRSAVRSMVNNGLTGFVDHGGHRWSPEAYVAMDVKTTMMNTSRAAVFERNEEYGNDLYQVSSHNGARPLCYPWQGKILSNSGRTGTTTDLYGNEIQIHSESEVESFRYGGGLFGVNCGHFPMVFIPTFSTIKGEPQDAEDNARTYAESQEQRALERKLREERRDLEVMKAQGASPEEIKAQKERIRAASNEIDEFCDRTGRTRKKGREGTPVNATWPDGTGGKVERYHGDYTQVVGQTGQQMQQSVQSGTNKTVALQTQNVAPQVTPTKSTSYTISDATISKKTVVANVGRSSEITLNGANVYTMPDGMEFVFKDKIDTSHQKATPEFVVDKWYKTPEALRNMGQKRVVVVDRYNPDDAYWKKTYKNFTHSYMTGGDDITVWRWDYEHPADYFVRALNHEIAHKVDAVIGNGSRYSKGVEWQNAMANDLKDSGKKSITKYGENSPTEDFAESIAEYVLDEKKFLKTMPNRGKIIQNKIMKGGKSP